MARGAVKAMESSPLHSSEMLRALCNRAVVAACYRTRTLHSHDHLLAVQILKLESADERSRIV